jgi:hypothetical protein
MAGDVAVAEKAKAAELKKKMVEDPHTPLSAKLTDDIRGHGTACHADPHKLL